MSSLLPRLTILLMTTISLAHGSRSLAQSPSAGRIALELDRLGVVGTVLYVAAHPDDENTRLLAWLANERGLRAAYVSLTRGDGGQNLVGPELGPLLGLIRTHELLAARGVDGAEQFFSRAVDFGYSKSAEETLAIWGKDAILSDLVRVVRTTKPDVIITRFSIDPPNHGHHTASSLLAREAFVVAADGAQYADQGLAAHQAMRLFENKSPWRFKEGEDLSGYLAIDVGGFSPLLGASYTELAADSRTMHKSQGFGTAPAYGPQLEYFEATTPDKWPKPMPERAADSKDPLAGLDFSWSRFPKTEALQKAIAAAQKAFDVRQPDKLVPLLVNVRKALAALPDDNPYKRMKLAAVDALLLDCAGVVLDARAKSPDAIPGEPLAVKVSAVARLAAIKVTAAGTTKALAKNEVLSADITLTPGTTYSTPYWLRDVHPTGLFAPPAPESGIAPVGAPDLKVDFTVELGGVALTVSKPVRYQWVDPVNGERFRAVEVLPAVTVTPTAHVRMFPDAAARPVEVKVRAHGGARKGVAKLAVPAGWKVSPAERAFDLASDGETTVVFNVTPSGTAPVELTAQAILGSQSIAMAEAVIDYLHVPRTTILAPAKVRAIPLQLKTGGVRIGYIAGAGDEVPASLTQVGYSVTMIDPKAVATTDLTQFTAIIAGIRSYNIEPGLKNAHPALMKFVENGGTYVVQYLTSNRQRPLGDVPIGPAPFTVDQGRVTDENAEVRVIDPTHPALNVPNKLGPEDYRGWVQERGLYFAATWDAAYKPLFSMNDAGDKPLEGAAIVARHGKGAFVYTGIGFFRQLPEGVPGAYRLMANLLALGAAK